LKKFAVLVVLAALLVPVAVAEEATPPERPGMVERALSWLGVRYRFGGQDENKGFDCAGLVRRVFSTIVDLPRTAAAQYRQGCIVERHELQPGDLVFFKNTYKRGISHVGIYIGGGEFVHAASRRRAVTVDRLDSPYFDKRFAGGRRVTTAAIVPPPVTAVEMSGAELGMP
jgi:cell wall-associated NlpC family hydrolase